MDLRIFVLAARLLSFAATADELGASPAYVSKRIALLERALGRKLFHRAARRITLSEDGKWALPKAQRVLAAYAELDDGPTHAGQSAQGSIRVTASAALGRNHVAPVLSELAATNPDLEIRLELVDRRIDLVDEDVDIDIRVGAVHEPHLIVHEIVPGRRILCASPAFLETHGTPRSINDLARLPCLLIRERDEPFGKWALETAGKSRAVNISSALSSNDGEIVRRWALSGHGIMLRSYWDIAKELNDGLLTHVLPDYFQRANVSAVTKVRTAGSHRIQLCVGLLRTRLRSGLHALAEP